jgi:cytochrome b
MSDGTLVEPAGRSARPAEIPVWDPLVRLFHWSLAVAFFTAWLSEDVMPLHEAAGYVVLGLVGFRVVWGVVGPQHARFTDFVRGPRAALAYLGDLGRGRARRYLGHNPAGGLMVVALLVMLTATGVTGWLALDAGRGWLEELHEGVANATLLLVGLHVLGVLVSSVAHGENLVRAMITGRKRAAEAV